MNNANIFNFFVITDIPGKKVLHVSVSPSLQIKLTEEFRKQRDAFLNEREIIDYRAAYHPDQDEIFKISPFDDLNDLLSITNSSSSVESLEPSPEMLEHVKAFFSTSDNPQELLFQNFDRRRIISNRSLAIIWAKNTYHHMEEPGLNLNKNLGAILRGDELLFHSSWAANRIFDLTSYLKEATDEQVKHFLTHTHFVMEDPQNTLCEFNGWMRTKVCLILESGVLNIPAQEMKIVAAYLQYDLQTNDSGNIIIPKGKKSLKRLLNFLSEDFMLSPLTEKLHFVTSKRPI